VKERSSSRVRGATSFLTLTSLLFAALAGAAVLQAPASAQDAGPGKVLFEQKCASCHSIGRGPLVGPDLKGITTARDRNWLVKFIATPDQVIASGDPVAKQLVQQYNGIQMPNLGLTSAQAGDLLAFIEQQSGAAPTAPSAAPTLPVGNAANGRELFAGGVPLTSGGAPCMACHDVAGAGALGGGTWGLDLTHAYSKWGEPGLISIMQTPPFPGMQQGFAGRSLTAQEVADLTSYLSQVDRQPAATASGWEFPTIGFVTFGVFALVAQIIWRGRLSGVRKPLLRAQGRPGHSNEPPIRRQTGSPGTLGGRGAVGGER